MEIGNPFMRAAVLIRCVMLAGCLVFTLPAVAAKDYKLGTGDVVKITVYNHADLTTEARINESGKLSFPLLGEVEIANLSTEEASTRLATLLSVGGLVQRPQVNIQVVRFRSPLVSILGEVAKPGKYPMRNPEADDVKTIADLLVVAGGPSPTAADYLMVTQRSANGQTVHKRVDLVALLARGDAAQNIPINEGDIVFVPRMELFYIYGEVHKPGAYRLEPDMSLMQALAVGGGVTARGTQRGIEIRRRDNEGKVNVVTSSLDSPLQANDVIYVKESLF
ncbi:MAG: polysaccharide export protein EpsE [Gammaproteobacteria bacterium]|nr:polysaccharide export protein EpsE [Gammaproteobacteria bacterium]